MLRRLKSDVETTLPVRMNVLSDEQPKVETILYVGMSHMQKELYKKVLMNDFDAVRMIGEGNVQLVNSRSERSHLMNLMMQLRKVAGHPYLFDGVEDRSLDPMGEHVIKV